MEKRKRRGEEGRGHQRSLLLGEPPPAAKKEAGVHISSPPPSSFFLPPPSAIIFCWHCRRRRRRCSTTNRCCCSSLSLSACVQGKLCDQLITPSSNSAFCICFKKKFLVWRFFRTSILFERRIFKQILPPPPPSSSLMLSDAPPLPPIDHHRDFSAFAAAASAAAAAASSAAAGQARDEIPHRRCNRLSLCVCFSPPLFLSGLKEREREKGNIPSSQDVQLCQRCPLLALPSSNASAFLFLLCRSLFPRSNCTFALFQRKKEDEFATGPSLFHCFMASLGLSLLRMREGASCKQDSKVRRRNFLLLRRKKWN